MSILEDVIKEMAAAGGTSAGSIASSQGSLFGGGMVDAKKSKKKQQKMFRRIMNVYGGGKVIKETLDVQDSETTFDASDVMSKLDSVEKKEKYDEDTAQFGMEDEDGNLVRVFVRREQAEDFEKALGAMLAGENDEDSKDKDSEEITALEIADVLYQLRDKFDIVDVVWPDIEGDEEEEQEVEGEPGAEGEIPGEGELGAEGEPGAEGEIPGEEGLPLDDEMGDEEDAKSALSQVIDMLKSDAEAKRAEAEAKKAEAEAKTAEFAARSADAKVKQEEDVLDMEAYYKDKSETDKEAKQLAKLAKYKHDQASDVEGRLSMESAEPKEDKNVEADDEFISLDQLAELIYARLRGQG